MRSHEWDSKECLICGVAIPALPPRWMRDDVLRTCKFCYAAGMEWEERLTPGKRARAPKFLGFQSENAVRKWCHEDAWEDTVWVSSEKEIETLVACFWMSRQVLPGFAGVNAMPRKAGLWLSFDLQRFLDAVGSPVQWARYVNCSGLLRLNEVEDGDWFVFRSMDGPLMMAFVELMKLNGWKVVVK